MIIAPVLLIGVQSLLIAFSVSNIMQNVYPFAFLFLVIFNLYGIALNVFNLTR
jgi:hypothetical protein